MQEKYFDQYEENIYEQGTKTPHYLFYYLDFILWHKNCVNENKDDKYYIIKKEIYDCDKFEFYRLNSIEHISPRNPIGGDQEKSIDSFGNLCLIFGGDNSSYSNHSFAEKKKIFDGKEKKSLKQALIFSVANGAIDWTEENIKTHCENMKNILNTYDINKK